ncbi:hypothetical protein KCU83_g656, partial [Aureobasidium melanogenum]
MDAEPNLRAGLKIQRSGMHCATQVRSASVRGLFLQLYAPGRSFLRGSAVYWRAGKRKISFKISVDSVKQHRLLRIQELSDGLCNLRFLNRLAFESATRSQQLLEHIAHDNLCTLSLGLDAVDVSTLPAYSSNTLIAAFSFSVKSALPASENSLAACAAADERLRNRPSSFMSESRGCAVFAALVTSASRPRSTLRRLVSLAFMAVFRSERSLRRSGGADEGATGRLLANERVSQSSNLVRRSNDVRIAHIACDNLTVHAIRGDRGERQIQPLSKDKAIRHVSVGKPTPLRMYDIFILNIHSEHSHLIRTITIHVIDIAELSHTAHQHIISRRISRTLIRTTSHSSLWWRWNSRILCNQTTELSGIKTRMHVTRSLGAVVVDVGLRDSEVLREMS